MLNKSTFTKKIISIFFFCIHIFFVISKPVAMFTSKRETKQFRMNESEVKQIHISSVRIFAKMLASYMKDLKCFYETFFFYFPPQLLYLKYKDRWKPFRYSNLIKIFLEFQSEVCLSYSLTA